MFGSFYASKPRFQEVWGVHYKCCVHDHYPQASIPAILLACLQSCIRHKNLASFEWSLSSQLCNKSKAKVGSGTSLYCIHHSGQLYTQHHQVCIRYVA